MIKPIFQFADKEEEGPFDIAFTTGNVGLFHDVASQQQFLTALDGDVDTLRDWALMKPEKYGILTLKFNHMTTCSYDRSTESCFTPLLTLF